MKLVVVGKIKERNLTELIDDYSNRIKKFTKFEIIVYKDYPDDDIELAKKKEGENLLKNIKKEDCIILLDLHGNEYTSEKFAKLIDELQIKTSKDIVFMIAGSNGFSEEVLNRANYRINLSKFTFPHNIVRLLVVEQIYRSFKIINNHNYHK